MLASVFFCFMAIDFWLKALYNIVNEKDGDIIMITVTLGTTGIVSQKNAFGALPIQRVSDEYAVMLLKKAYDAGAKQGVAMKAKYTFAEFADVWFERHQQELIFHLF